MRAGSLEVFDDGVQTEEAPIQQAICRPNTTPRD